MIQQSKVQNFIKLCSFDKEETESDQFKVLPYIGTIAIVI